MQRFNVALALLIVLVLSAFQSTSSDGKANIKPAMIASTLEDETVISSGYVYVNNSKSPFILRASLNNLNDARGFIIDLGCYGVLSSSRVLDDGSIVAVGYVYTRANGYDILVTRIKNDSQVLWAYALGGENHDIGVDVTSVNNKIIVAGYSYSFGFKGMKESNIIVLKMDLSGKILESRVMGTEVYDDFVRKVYKTAEGDLLLLGETWS